jgi:hypothetical protein
LHYASTTFQEDKFEKVQRTPFVGIPISPDYLWYFNRRGQGVKIASAKEKPSWRPLAACAELVGEDMSSPMANDGFRAA